MKSTPWTPGLRPILPLLSLLPACGGGSSGGGEAILNEGTYSVEDFHYSGTRPAGYHPLGGDTVNLTRRTEVALSIPGSSTWFRTVEDPSEGGGVVSGSGAYLSSSMAIWGQKAARLDRDAEEELVTLERVSGNQLKVWRTDFHSGTASTTLLATLNHSAWQIEACNLSVGDIDHDGLDEIAVVGRRELSSSITAHVWMLDDPEQGSGSLLDEVFSAGASSSSVGQPTSRAGLSLLFGHFDATGAVRAMLVSERGACKELSWNNNLHRVEFSGGTSMASTIEGSSYAPYGIPVAGDFDGDGLSDVAQCSLGLVRIYHRSSGGAWSYFGQAGTNTATLMPHAAVSYAIDRNTDGVALLYNSSNQNWAVLEAWYDPNLPFDMGSRTDLFVSSPSPTWPALAVGDADADGQVELEVLLFRDSDGNTGSHPRVRIGRVEMGASPTVDWYLDETWTGGVYGTDRVPALAAVDWDADGMALAFTGLVQPKLFDPIPLVVMCAPPVKADIGQNLDDSEVAFETGQASGQTWGVTTGITATASVAAGFDVADLFGVEAKATVELAVERSQETTERINLVQGYRGAADADVVLFQGTLYMSYEYVILSALDPNAVGQYITLDFPVAEKLYKWTVPYYNSAVPPQFQIETSVLTHVPGDPSTYPTRTEMLADIGDDMKWLLPNALPVGQGSGSSYQRIEFEQEITSSTQTTWSYGGSVSSNTAGLTLETSTMWSEGSMYGISLSNTSVFEAAVGDIADPTEYQQWNYDWGIAVQSVGRRANATTNLPVDLMPDRHCYQVIRYWVEPTGSAW